MKTMDEKRTWIERYKEKETADDCVHASGRGDELNCGRNGRRNAIKRKTQDEKH